MMPLSSVATVPESSTATPSGLMACQRCIKAENSSPPEVERPKRSARVSLRTPVLNVWPGAALGKIELEARIGRPGEPGAETEMVLPQIPEDEKNTESAAAVEIGGTRDVIKGYSKASRRRQLRAMSKVKRSALKRNPGIFLTLTYPGFGAGEDWRDWKYHMKKFAERFKYNFPTATATWRMELVERKSGAAAGKLVPHFHLLAFAVPLDKIRQRHKLDYAGSLQWFRDWAAKAWWKCVGSGDETHLRAGTSVEIIRNWRKVMAYTSKYIAKTTDDIDGTLMEVGRWWGIINKAAWAEISVADDAVRRIALTRRNGLKMWAWARAFVGIPDDAGYRLPSVHFFVDSDWLLDNWESIVNGEYAVTAAVPPSMTDDYGG